MRKILLLLSIIIFSCATEEKTTCNYITDYYPTIYKADIEFRMGNYGEAFALYRDAFNSCEAKNTSTYYELSNFTESSAILEKYDITYEYSKKTIQNGIELSSFENNPNFEEFLLSDYGKKFIAEYDSLRQEFIDNADLELRDELTAMRTADQLYRNQGSDADWTKQDSIDKLHEERLFEIFETIGYPTDKIVGPHTMDYKVDVNLLLLHTDDSIRMHYFVPKVKEFVKNGTAPPRSLGTMIDQYHLYNGEPQIYGTYEAQEGGYANMIDNLEKVDSNRISIGLPKLELKEKKDSLNRVNYGF